ncbi:MAG TPA: hypothetical protein VJ183_07190 [Chloroflexia bacterium]|nr:hypothetical protein [Chloroflexia bacterium]
MSGIGSATFGLRRRFLRYSFLKVAAQFLEVLRALTRRDRTKGPLGHRPDGSYNSLPRRIISIFDQRYRNPITFLNAKKAAYLGG